MPKFETARAAFLATLLCLALAPRPVWTAAPTVDPGKRALIQRLISLNKSVDMAVQAIEAAVPTQAAAAPQIPPQFWDEFAVLARQEAPKMVELLIPIYDKHYTRPQLEQLIKFFESPAGQAMVKSQPAIMDASMKAGQEWGNEIGKKASEAMARRGIAMPR